MNTSTNTVNTETKFNLVSFSSNCISTPEQYVAFVRAWRMAYKILTKEIRYQKISSRYVASLASRKDGKASPSLETMFAAAENQRPKFEELEVLNDAFNCWGVPSALRTAWSTSSTRPRSWSISSTRMATQMIETRLAGKIWVKEALPWPNRVSQ